MDLENMDHAEIMAVLKSYYAGLLESNRAKIDKNGPLPKENVERLKNSLQEWEEAIKGDADDLTELLGLEYEDPNYDPLKEDLQNVMKHSGLSFAPDSEEYKMLKAGNKHVRRAYIKDLLSYNSSVTDFSLLNAVQSGKAQIVNLKPGQKLGNVIKAYLNEIKSNLTDRSHNEQRDCLSYLTDWLGEDFSISKVDDAKAQEVKEFLRNTPKGRNKSKLTGKLSIAEQIAVAKEHELPMLSSVSVNKYLAYFESLFDWARRNKYVSENPFADIRVKASKKKERRRDKFTKEEVVQIINGLDNEKLIRNKSNYWGALIAVYTGARRNEIASLLPDDVKQDEVTGIWYFDITDDEEGKSLKTQAAKRIVPVHSQLINSGFLDFVKQSRAMRSKIKHEDGQEPRLLYDLTYTGHQKWGRNLGQWFNNTYLKALGLKSEKKTLHSLRHSFITYLSAAGVDNASIKSLVGHEPDTVTTATYTHYGVDHLKVFKEAIEKLPY